jgi:sRNA-binding carbon storage regulator CsrA
MGLRIDLKPGESVAIGDIATVTLEQKSGQIARLSFTADRSIPITRVETRGNIAAIAGVTGKP